MSEQPLPNFQTPPQIGPSELERIMRKQNIRQRIVEADSGWQSLTFTGGISNFGAGHRTIGVRKQNGEIKLRGLALIGGINGAGGTLMTIPIGFRPSLIEVFTQDYNNAAVRLDINPSGAITLPAQATAAGSFISLAGIRYYQD